MTPYETLGLDASATADQIRDAFRKLAAAHHPDRNPGDPNAHARMRDVNAAYHVLGDEGRRAAYDASGEGWEDPDALDPVAMVREAAVDVVEQDLLPEVARCLAGVKKGGPVVAHLREMGSRMLGRMFQRAGEMQRACGAAYGAPGGARAAPAEPPK